MSYNWAEIIDTYKDNLLDDLFGLLRIPSIKNLSPKPDEGPFGQGILDALNYMENLGRRDGLSSENFDNYALHLEVGQGQELIGILSHLDVVPVDNREWDSHPFKPILKDGKIFARGALDDKGPAIMAYYAIKILQDLGVTWDHRIRLIYGTDEENNWEGVSHYFKHAEMPTFGIVPDGIFPMIYAEKGVASFNLIQEGKASKTLLSFSSGSAYNMVPDKATAEVVVPFNLEDRFTEFLNRYHVTGNYSQQDDHQELIVYGRAAHAAGPAKGINAASYLAHFLKDLDLDTPATDFLSFIDTYFFEDTQGQRLGISFRDRELGDLTVNLAILEFSQGKCKIGINLRYPSKFDFDNQIVYLGQLAQKSGYTLEIISHQKPSYTDLTAPETQLLLDTYRDITRDTSAPLAIGGITYGRIFDRGVTFGVSFLGKPATLHQPNEYIEWDDLLLSLQIYLEALYRLATIEGKHNHR